MTKHFRRSQPDEIPVTAFLDDFMRVHEMMPERSFAFVLGAGASVTSGIASGATLVDEWLGELHRRDPDRGEQSVQEWATPDNLEIDDFAYERRAEFYPQLYDARFGDDPESGYAYLEDAMKDAVPGLGYSMLAQVLADSRHKVVITTNFDNLVADAVLMFTNTFAQVCGHESLTGFIRTRPRRPLVAKIHRDLLMGPHSDPLQTNVLHEDWSRTLRGIFAQNTPVFVGYGGNDGSLMNFLVSLPAASIPGGIYWCYRNKDELTEPVKRLVVRQRGRLVQIVGFDLFMVQVAEPLGFGLLDARIEQEAKKRADRLRQEWKEAKGGPERMPKAPAAPDAAGDAARDALEKVEARRAEGADWWSWQLKVLREPEPTKQEEIYRKALEQLPNSPELTGNFALFMDDVRKNYDEAERLYRRGLQLDPNDAKHAGNFAIFMKNVRKNYDEAERLHRRALELDPSNATHTGNLATFMRQVRKDYDEAERLYRRALELDPSNATNTGNFASFIHRVRKDHDEAERLYRRALELDPRNATHTGNFASFMKTVRKDYDEAEKLYRRALELAPSNATSTANLTGFLLARGRYGEAQTMADRAWGLTHAEREQAAAEVALYRSLLLRVDERDDTQALGRLKAILQAGFERGSWSFDDVLATASESLGDDAELYAALAEAILDQEKVAALDKFPRWREVKPIPLDEPWPPLAEGGNEG